MIEVRQKALDKLQTQFARQAHIPLRIALVDGSGEKAILSLSFDQPRKDDLMLTRGGYTFVVARKVLSRTGTLTVDADNRGFHVRSEKSLCFQNREEASLVA